MKKLAEIVGSLSSSKLPNIWRGVRVRLNELVLKTKDRAIGPGVRIPPPSLAEIRKKGSKINEST